MFLGWAKEQTWVDLIFVSVCCMLYTWTRECVFMFGVTATACLPGGVSAPPIDGNSMPDVICVHARPTTKKNAIDTASSSHSFRLRGGGGWDDFAVGCYKYVCAPCSGACRVHIDGYPARRTTYTHKKHHHRHLRHAVAGTRREPWAMSNFHDPFGTSAGRRTPTDWSITALWPKRFAKKASANGRVKSIIYTKYCQSYAAHPHPHTGWVVSVCASEYGSAEVKVVEK